MTSPETWRKRLLFTLIFVFCLPSISASALSESRTFFATKIYDQRLELCVAAGTGCGKKAADTWCRHVGYSNAMNYRLIRNDRPVERALLMGHGELCAKDACNGFQFVKCQRDPAQ